MNVRLRLLSVSCFFNLGAFNLLGSFLTIYLKNCGMSEAQIGAIMAWGTCLSLVAVPLLGNLADRFQSVKPIALVLILIHAMVSFLYVFARGYFHFLGLGMLRSVVYSASNALVPLVVLSVLPAGKKGRQYGGYRKWGSVGYFSFAVLGGYIVERFGIRSLFPLAALFFALAALFFGVVRTGRPETEVKHVRLRDILAHRELLVLYAALVPFAVWAPASFSFLPIYMRKIGASYTLVGYLMGSMGLMGIVGLPIVGRFTDRFGVKRIIALNFLIIPLRLWGYPLFENPYWVFVPNLLHLLTFPINEVCFLLYIERYCRPELRNTAMGLVSTFRHLGGIGGALLCGTLAQYHGYKAMFYITGVISGISFIIFILGHLKIRK